MSFIHTSKAGNRAPKGDFTRNLASLQTRGFVGWWPGFEGGGNIIRDYSGFGNHAVGNSNSWEHSIFENAANDFEAGQDFTATIPAIDPDDGITMSFWAYSSVYAGSNVGFTLRSGGSAGDAILIYPYDSVSGDGARIWHGSNSINQNGAGLNDKIPHLFTYVNRSASDRELYVDGISVGTDFTSRSMSTLNSIDLGHWNGSQDAAHSGFDFRLQNIAISPSEIRHRYAPQTRWELYAQQDRRVAFSPEVAPAGAIINQFQGSNMGADLYNGTLI